MIIYDDADGNLLYDFSETARQYCPGAAPTAVDTTGGAVSGITLDVPTTCVYP